jgi:hypothetical protein
MGRPVILLLFLIDHTIEEYTFDIFRQQSDLIDNIHLACEISRIGDRRDFQGFPVFKRNPESEIQVRSILDLSTYAETNNPFLDEIESPKSVLL